MPHHVQDGRGKLFYESLEVTEQETTDKQFVFPKQCLVLGDSEVGKTSLVRSLTRKAFDPNQQKTQGIDWSLVDHDWKNCNLKDLVFGDLWRFLETGLVEMLWITTGRETSYNVAQEVTVIMTDKEYYAYHHIFLKSQAIYVIVFNIANFVEYNFRNINAGIVRLQFWLESVCSHVPPATPIFLVGTHRGDMDKTCMERLNVHLKTNLWDFYCDELVVNDVEELIFFPVENSIGENDVGIQSLQTKIMSVAEKSLATIDCDIPLSWISIQDAIINLREKKEAKFCVTLEEFPRALDNFICTNWSEETFKYFHEKGLVIYLDKDQELSKWVLLKPEILVDIIIQLVTPPPQMMQERGVRRDWKLLKDKGMLTQSLLESIFSKVQKNEEAMTAFLEEYDLICPLLNKKVKICSLCDDEEYQPTHFVPSLLPMSTDCSIPAWHDSTADKKFYVLFTRFLPEPLFHRMLSRAHKNSKVEFPNGPAVVFRDVGKFWMSPWQPYRLKLMKEEGVIEVTFSSSSKNGMKPADVLCQVFSMVDGICKRDFPFVKFHCGPACPADECPGYHDNYIGVGGMDTIAKLATLSLKGVYICN
ncbi:hypothetical protein ACROYT_G013470 [Oculina patagonica]